MSGLWSSIPNVCVKYKEYTKPFSFNQFLGNIVVRFKGSWVAKDRDVNKWLSMNNTSKTLWNRQKSEGANPRGVKIRLWIQDMDRDKVIQVLIYIQMTISPISCKIVRVFETLHRIWTMFLPYQWHLYFSNDDEVCSIFFVFIYVTHVLKIDGFPQKQLNHLPQIMYRFWEGVSSSGSIGIHVCWKWSSLFDIIGLSCGIGVRRNLCGHGWNWSRNQFWPLIKGLYRNNHGFIKELQYQWQGKKWWHINPALGIFHIIFVLKRPCDEVHRRDDWFDYANHSTYPETL